MLKPPRPLEETQRLRALQMMQVLDTPADDEDIHSAADQWISTLKAQEERALAIIDMLEAMILKY